MAVNYTPVLETATTLASPHSSRSGFGAAGAQLPPPPGPSGRAPPADGAAALDMFAPTVAPRRLSEARPSRCWCTLVHGTHQLFFRDPVPRRAKDHMMLVSLVGWHLGHGK